MDIPNQDIRKSIIRTLSEEYYARSPTSRDIIKFMTQTTPTSKFKKEYTNIDEYNSSTDEKKQFMIKYQMVPDSFVLSRMKKKQ